MSNSKKKAPAKPSTPVESQPVARRADDAEGASLVGTSELATAMQMQAEILNRIHQTQSDMQQSLQKERRSEMMIQSTRALNDSFRGMQKTQEKLLDQLSEERSSPRRTGYIILGGVLLIALVIGVTGFWITDVVRDTGSGLVSDTIDRQSAAALAELESLGERLQGLEAKDREVFTAELDKLRRRVESMSEERARLIAERDRLNQERGSLAARLEAAEKRVTESDRRRSVAEQETERLTRARMGDQELVRQLNATLAAVRAGEAVRPAGPAGTKHSAAGEQDTERVAIADDPEAAPDVASEPVARPADSALVDRLNELLTNHRSSNRYELREAREFDADGLKGIILNERGADGSLIKTYHAERLRFRLGKTGRTMSLAFAEGHVVFRQGGREIKSPFFRGTYDLVIFGVPHEPWLTAKLPFNVGP